MRVVENLVGLVPFPDFHHEPLVLQLVGDGIEAVVDGGVGGCGHEDLLAHLHQEIDDFRDGEGLARAGRPLDEVEVVAGEGFADSLVLRRVAAGWRRRFTVLVAELSREEPFEVVAEVGAGVKVFPCGVEQPVGDVGVHGVDFPTVPRTIPDVHEVVLDLVEAGAQGEVVHLVALDLHHEEERPVAESHLRALAELRDVVVAADARTVDVARRADGRGREPRGRPVVELELRVQVGHGVASVYALLQRPAHQFVVFLILP